MSAPVTLDDCGCCEGIGAATPVQVKNRPGLSAVAYRVGTYAQFFDSMLARLADQSWAKLQGLMQDGTWALQALRTRSGDDFTIALLDAWAVVGDILTFYQERIANEGYLGTATEELSLRELARLIGYEPRPGVAAIAWLAFTLEEKDATGSPFAISLPAGMRVQSVPGPGELPQTFETVSQIEARTRWNALKPRLMRPQTLSETMQSVTIAGVSTNVKAGDTVLLVVDGHPFVKRAVGVIVDSGAKTTQLAFVDVPSAPSYAPPVLPTADAMAAMPADLTDGVVAQYVLGRSWAETDLVTAARKLGWSLDALAESAARQAALPEYGSGLYAMRVRASLFGHNAPRWDTLPAVLRYGTKTRGADGTVVTVAAAFPSPGWEKHTLKDEAGYGAHQVYLDNTYPGIVPHSYVVLDRPPHKGESHDVTHVYTVASVAETTRSDYAISAKATMLKLNTHSGFEEFGIRETSVLGQSEELALAQIPIEEAISGDHVTLDGLYLGLEPGRTILLTGERTDPAGQVASEAATIFRTTIDGGFTTLYFVRALEHAYVRSTLTINANVAPATHGETVQASVGGVEVLGSGDATRPFQRFALRQTPLTYTSADTPSGSESSLTVRVNDVTWDETPTLYGVGPGDRVYALLNELGGGATVVFGDGKTGARLPTGADNVKAAYRKGLGTAGNVKAGQLSVPMTRPLGVKGVGNPLPASGAEDPEGADQIRTNALLPILTMGRIVSLQDYEDFARAFAGIGKALATWTWDGQRQGVYVTVAGAGGTAAPDGSDLQKNLLAALRASGDPYVPIAVGSYTASTFSIAGTVHVDPAYRSDLVMAAISSVLRDRFSFDNRAFGQPVLESEVMAFIHLVPGVVSVALTGLYRSGSSPSLTDPLTAAVPEPGTNLVSPAELLTLDPCPIGLEAAT